VIAPNDEALSLPSRCSSTANVDARRARTDEESGEVIELRLTELWVVRHAHVLTSGSITNSISCLVRGRVSVLALDLLRSVQLRDFVYKMTSRPLPIPPEEKRSTPNAVAEVNNISLTP
jgi:hypothetical protein